MRKIFLITIIFLDLFIIYLSEKESLILNNNIIILVEEDIEPYIKG